MSDNPFQSPVEPADSGNGKTTVASNPLLGPAIILLVLSCLWLVIQILSLPIQIIRIGEEDLSSPQGPGIVTGQIATLVAWFVLTIAVIIGSINMIRLKNRRSVMLAIYISLVPFCGSPCIILGIPIGIWALTLMYKPRVKSLFTS